MNAISEDEDLKDDANTHMPWHAYAGISEADRRALWAFFAVLPKVSNPVRQWDGPSAPDPVRGG